MPLSREKVVYLHVEKSFWKEKRIIENLMTKLVHPSK